VAERIRVREISNEEGQRLLRMVHRSSGSVVTWRPAQLTGNFVTTSPRTD
jgi:hypothetical protein